MLLFNRCLVAGTYQLHPACQGICDSYHLEKISITQSSELFMYIYMRNTRNSSVSLSNLYSIYLLYDKEVILRFLLGTLGSCLIGSHLSRLTAVGWIDINESFSYR